GGELVGVLGAVTPIEKAGRAALAVPSLALMTIFEYMPVLEDVGVPDRAPVAMLKLAQEGLFCTLKDSVAPLESLAVGWNLYVCPACTEVAGEPLIVTVGVVVPPLTG